MKMIKFLAAAVCGALPISVLAVPLDIELTGGAPVQEWGESGYGDPGFQDYILPATVPQAINLAGVNSITVTWNAPAGYMYVVDPPPAGVVENEAALIFEAEYGSPGQASSLGSITASSFSINTVYGTAPLGAQVLTSSPEVGLSFGVSGTVSASSAPFAFTSMTISADFSGIGASTLSPTGDGPPAAGLFAEYTGDFEIDGVAPDGTVLYDVPPDPGQLLTLEPLPTGSVPDAPSTVILAGLSFAGFWLCGRKLSPDNH